MPTIKPVILQYTKGSKSAKALQQWLQQSGFPRLRRTLDPKANRIVINWGCSKVIPLSSHIFINHPALVNVAGNKQFSFETFKLNGLAIPLFTTNKDEALAWIKDGHLVVGRQTLRGHSGQGIVLSTEDDIESCPLYVQYKKKRHEYRVHVVQDKIIDVQQKRRRKDVTDINSKIRNAHTGWVYCRDNVTLPEDASKLATDAVKCLSLDFGAVDIIWNEKENKSYLLEVNCAPGLEGETVVSYGQQFKEIINGINT